MTRVPSAQPLLPSSRNLSSAPISEEVAAISDEQLISALESDIKPSRLQCALLPLEALRAGLKEYTVPVNTHRLKRNAVTRSRIAASLEDEAELMSAVRVVHQWMDSHAVKKNG